MSDESITNKRLSHLESEIDSLRKDDIRQIADELRQLRSALCSPEAIWNGEKPKVEFQVFVRKVNSERKPFVFELSGAIEQLFKASAVRGCILLALFLDLQDRSSGGRGIIDPISRIKELYSQLVGTKDDDDNVLSNIRVALYRFELYLSDTSILNGGSLELKFDQESCRLIPAEDRLSIEDINVNVVCGDYTLSRLLEAFLNTSPLQKVRKSRALHVGSEPAAQDRLLLELFDHKLQVREIGLFYRFSIHSFPVHILEKIGVSDNRIKRAKLVQDGYASNRVQFKEILSRQSVKDYLQHDPTNNQTKLTKADYKDHLRFLLSLVNDTNNYNLVLTDAFFPFYITSFHLGSINSYESFTLFFGPPTDTTSLQTGSLAICNRAVDESIRSGVIRWVEDHPSTTHDKRLVSKELSELLDQL